MFCQNIARSVNNVTTSNDSPNHITTPRITEYKLTTDFIIITEDMVDETTEFNDFMTTESDDIMTMATSRSTGLYLFYI